MNNGKPNNPTFLTPDRPIGANVNKGFADTFNWLVRFCNNLQGDGYYINVENEQGDQPVITWGDTPPGEGSGGGGEVTFSGTDSSSHTGTSFKFLSASNSNISVTIDNTGVMTIGAYYI